MQRLGGGHRHVGVIQGPVDPMWLLREGRVQSGGRRGGQGWVSGSCRS